MATKTPKTPKAAAAAPSSDPAPIAAPSSAPTPAPAARAVLADGPAEMNFCGRQWQRGRPQPVTPEQWSAMQQRGAERLGFHLLTEEN